MNTKILISLLLFLGLITNVLAQTNIADSLVRESESNVKLLRGNFTITSKTYEKEDDKGTRTAVDFSYEHSSEAIYLEGRNLVSRSYFNIDLGKSIWQGNEAAPDVRVWGSWMVGLNFVRQSKVTNHFYIKSMAGFHFHNFKFSDDNIQAVRSDQNIDFINRENGIKSKVAASYLTVAIIPKISTGYNGFRLGVGPYAGYRLGGRSKFVYSDSGRQKDFDTSSMYLENLRYGVRGEIGASWFDFFFNYDLNHVFESGRGPEVNAISFGIIL
ncbi:MAG TPA: outer membrane beta-barrel protein [Anditalea sp.]|nr:outer membrane beta-barrel protein [Anditalea sp.]